ncbi:hypothetical protein [Sedimenticola sp.]|uniref:hypothetical protein n=1 Tax=Sedimenticola sp. TaxID=1940285 RepID=UPI003D0D8B8A
MSEHVAEKRDTIIAALGFPRLLMEREIKRRACPQHYHFNEQAEECVDCLYILECQSFSKQLAEPELMQASARELARLLQFGFEYVSYQPERQDHETARCACELCDWIRAVTPMVDLG